MGAVRRKLATRIKLSVIAAACCPMRTCQLTVPQQVQTTGHSRRGGNKGGRRAAAPQREEDPEAATQRQALIARMQQARAALIQPQFLHDEAGLHSYIWNQSTRLYDQLAPRSDRSMCCRAGQHSYEADP